MVNTNDITMSLGKAPLDGYRQTFTNGNTFAFPVVPPFCYRIVKTIIFLTGNLNQQTYLVYVKNGLSYAIGYNQSNVLLYRYYNTDFPIILEPGTNLQIVDAGALNNGGTIYMTYYDYNIEKMQQDISFKKGRRG